MGKSEQRTSRAKRKDEICVSGTKLLVADSGNIHSVGPSKVMTAVQNCIRHMHEKTNIVAADVLCGNGVIPVVMRHQFPSAIKMIYASDCEKLAVQTTKTNLRKFQADGAAPVQIFRHNILLPFADHDIPDDSLHLVLTDPPYGNACSWIDTNNTFLKGWDVLRKSLLALFTNLEPKMREKSVIGIITDVQTRVEQSIGSFTLQEEVPIHGNHQHDARTLHIMKKS